MNIIGNNNLSHADVGNTNKNLGKGNVIMLKSFLQDSCNILHIFKMVCGMHVNIMGK